MRTDDILKDSIVFFSNSGKIISRTPYKEADRVKIKITKIRFHYSIFLKMNI